MKHHGIRKGEGSYEFVGRVFARQQQQGMQHIKHTRCRRSQARSIWLRSELQQPVSGCGSDGAVMSLVGGSRYLGFDNDITHMEQLNHIEYLNHLER